MSRSFLTALLLLPASVDGLSLKQKEFLQRVRLYSEAVDGPCDKPCGACDKAFMGLKKDEDKEACMKCKGCFEESDEPAACEKPCKACPIVGDCKPCIECSNKEEDDFFFVQTPATGPCDKPCGACDKAFGGLKKKEEKAACMDCKSCHEKSDDPAACEKPCKSCPIVGDCKPCIECSHKDHDDSLLLTSKAATKTAENPCGKPCGACDKAFGGLKKKEEKAACMDCKSCHEKSDDPAACEKPCKSCPIVADCKPCIECSHKDHGDF